MRVVLIHVYGLRVNPQLAAIRVNRRAPNRLPVPYFAKSEAQPAWQAGGAASGPARLAKDECNLQAIFLRMVNSRGPKHSGRYVLFAWLAIARHRCASAW